MALNPPPIRETDQNSPVWQKWYISLQRFLTDSAGLIPWSSVNKSSSNITDIPTRHHDDLQNLNTATHTHLTAVNAVDLTDGNDSLLHYHASDRDRGNHTGAQTSSTISDFSAASDARIALHVAASDPHTQYELKANFNADADARIALHVAAADPHTQYQKTSEKDSASGYAGLNASSRITKGVDTQDDLIVDLATKGLVLKDTQGTPHYWRVTITTLGVLTTTDLGTTKP